MASGAVSPRHADRRLLLYLALVLLDIAAVMAAFATGVMVRFDAMRWHSAFDVVVVTLPVYVLTAFNTGAYSITALRRWRIGMVRALWSLLFAFATFTFISYYFRLSQFSPRSVVSIGMMGSLALVALGRWGFGRLIEETIGPRIITKVLIVDDFAMEAPPGWFALDAAAADLRPNLHDPMMLDRLARHLRGVDRVVVACRPASERTWSMLLKGVGIAGEIVSSEFDQVGAIAIGRIGRRSTLVVATGPLSLRNRLIKRTFDLGFAVPALIALLPVFLLIAVAIKLDSRGPVFFRQKRVGRGNALFEVYKFRSMRAERSDAEGSRSASRDDDRITRVGRIIRATSMDELPQLLNVLFGSMSIVGPRPHALGSLAGQQLFWEVDERYWHRHVLKPGITGLAQVRGFRGATHQRSDLTQRLHADLEYVVDWSVLRDLAILISTFRVLVHRNAF